LIENKYTVLDLSYNGSLNKKYSQSYDQIAIKNRKLFTDFIERLSSGNENNLDWWVSGPASRNIYTSPLFHYFCSLLLVDDLIKSGESFIQFTTDSKALSKILSVKFNNRDNYSIKYTSNTISHIKSIFIAIYYIIYTPVYFLSNKIAALLTSSLKKQLHDAPLTLIDTFVVGSNFDDRYYPGLWEKLTDTEKKNIFFLPTIVQQKLFPFKTYSFLRKSEKNFLIKEDYLCFVDYWYAWKYWLRVIKIPINKTILFDYDLTNLVREEILRFDGFFTAFLGLLNSRFVYRLRSQKVDIQLFINWFENQVIDKGINFGFHKHYPKTIIKGYQGFAVSHHQLSFFPTNYELDCCLMPDEISVTGKGFVQKVNEFINFKKKIPISVAPAFRFNNVWRKRKYYPNNNVFTIFICLSIVLKESKIILGMINDLAGNNQIQNIEFILKIHPVIPRNKIDKMLSKKLNDLLEIVSDDFDDIIEKSNLLITSGSSTLSLNAIAKGIPAIIIYDNHGLIHNPIPPEVNCEMWRLCSNGHELLKSISYYKKNVVNRQNNYKVYGDSVKEYYFQKVTRKGVLDFISI
jgi:hypothetical protein